MVTTNYGLGRIEEFDERSRNFPIRTLIPSTLAPRSYTWSCAPRIDQGSEGSCVGHAWAHEIAARPRVRPADHGLALEIYRKAQLIDEFSTTPPQEGTSVLAGVKIATQLGYYQEYRWAFSLNDLIMAIGYKGPAVLGIPWYEGMFLPDRNGLISITGQLAGGHAILANGVSVSKKLIRLHNSWGANWGLNGECFIRFEDLEFLLHQQGEACIPVKRV